MKDQSLPSNSPLSPDTALSAIVHTIKDFLASQGSMSNGYETYVRGKVQVNALRALDWCAPNVSDMTLRRHKELGTRLNDDIRAILYRANLFEIQIVAKHVEHGCYNTFVTVTRELPVKLD